MLSWLAGSTSIRAVANRIPVMLAPVKPTFVPGQKSVLPLKTTGFVTAPPFHSPDDRPVTTAPVKSTLVPCQKSVFALMKQSSLGWKSPDPAW